MMTKRLFKYITKQTLKFLKIWAPLEDYKFYVSDGKNDFSKFVMHLRLQTGLHIPVPL